GRSIRISILLASACLFAGCPAAPTTNTVTTNVSNANVNTNTNINTNTMSSTTTTGTTSAVDTKEPEKYQAVVKLKFETTGEQKMTIPEIQATVAKNGADRRMEFTMPGTNEKVVYLDTNGKHLLVLPCRKQFAELNKESVGVAL